MTSAEPQRQVATIAPQEGGAQSRLSITVLIIAFNEEIHIERCLSRVLPIAERVVVIDSFSTDRTVEIARAMGAEVLQHKWKNHADQFQWGIDNVEVTTDWILRVDCDEYLEPEAMAYLRRQLGSLPADVGGVIFKRKFIFRERWIKHGRYYPTLHLRLWRTGLGAVEQRWMDEHVVLSRGRTLVATGDLVDHNLNDIGWWTDKHNGYATRHMVDFINREHGLYPEDERIKHTDGDGRRRRFLKNSVYARAPLYLRAVLFYIYRYVFRLGFLDGKDGFLFHFLHGFWVMMLIDAKIDEARTYIRRHGLEAFKQHLRTHHKIEL